jgi:lipoate-protein ligase B
VRPLYGLDLGLVPYLEALALQRAAARLRIAGELPEDLVLLVQHPPVITLGRGFKAPHLLATPEALERAGVALHEVERGGDITVHEPGQLVGYVVLDLKAHRKDLHWFLRMVELGVIDGVAALGVHADRRPGLTGVWVQDRKLASIGVHARDWVTWHGFALNVTNDLSTFAHTVPCGLDGVVMTSVANERPDVPVSFAEVTRRTHEGLARAFAREPLPAPPEVLRLLRAT